MLSINFEIRAQLYRFVNPIASFSHFWSLFLLVVGCSFWINPSDASLQYATRTESVKWQMGGSKFFCRLSHQVEGFGEAIFEREAGEQTRFLLNSQMPRMKTGKAALVAKPPAWSSQPLANTLAMVAVKEGMRPIVIDRKLAERMLAELQKGMLLEFKRQPLYGDPREIRVTLSSIGFRGSHQEYLECLSHLLPVNFNQIEKSTLNYDNDDDDLTEVVKQRLDQVVAYIEEDPEVKTFYLDGHTDSEGIRNENLIKSQRRTEKVMDYLIEKGIPRDRIIARWHGERYQVASNRTPQGKRKNRRVTLRLSKELPQTLVEAPESKAETTSMLDKRETE
jgi:outer membrane protein OmpA-like peptidoglycan-associated protein